MQFLMMMNAVPITPERTALCGLIAVHTEVFSARVNPAFAA